MINLVKPSLKHQNKYEEMINEWKKFGGPYVPCIIEYSCNNKTDKLYYNNVLKFVYGYITVKYLTMI